MLIANFTNKLKSDLFEITKGFSQLIVSASQNLEQFTNETIDIYIERSGDTVDICKNVLVKDFLILSTQSNDAVFPNGTFKSVAVCELTENGGNIVLHENEKIKVQLNNTKTGVTYQMNTLEGSYGANEVFEFVRKTIALETLNHDFDCRGYDCVSIQKDDTISEINLHFDNGNVVKLNQYEAEVWHKSTDTVAQMLDDGTVKSGYDDRLVFNLVGIKTLNVRKDNPSTAAINVTFKIDEGDADFYGVSRKKVN